MKRYLYFTTVCLILLSSCSQDEGLTTKIQKVALISFELNTNDHLDDDGTLNSFQNVNLTNREFDAYLEQIEDFEINRIAFSVKGLDQTRSFAVSRFEELRLYMRGIEDPELEKFFSLDNIVFGEAGVFEIYKKDSLHDSSIEQTVKMIRVKSLLRENTVWNLSGNLPQSVPNLDFELELLIDMSAIVALR